MWLVVGSSYSYSSIDDFDVLVGFWEEVFFVRLLCDVFSELKDLVEDIDNLKCVYVVYKVS